MMMGKNIMDLLTHLKFQEPIPYIGNIVSGVKDAMEGLL